jgi:ABC-type glycerol-3-phosphate transport system substrate-binding protein
MAIRMLLISLAWARSLPVYLLDVNRSVLSPEITSNTENFFQAWPSTPSNTIYLRAGNLEETECLRIWQPFDIWRGGGNEARTLLNATFTLLQTSDVSCFEVKNADWGGVASAPICTNSTTECPDVIVLGTTQIAGRVAANDLFPLNGFFNQFATRTGEIFSDNFIQKYFYDYFYGGNWIGIPLNTDVRIMYYNKTTFDRLNLKYPPPHGSWVRDEWNWKKFTEYAIAINGSMAGPGFEFGSGWDEELKLVTMAARDYQITLVNNTGKCGLTGTAFKRLYDEVLFPLFGPYGAANRDFLPTGHPELLRILSSPMMDPLEQPMICCSGSAQKAIGMTIDTPSWAPYHNHRYHPRISPNGTIGQVYMPGKATFLGGAGMTITAKSKRKELAWAYMELFSKAPFSVIFNTNLNTLSPYYQVMDGAVEWAGAEYDTVKEQYKRAIPVQYPQSSFPQFTELESRKPFRALLLEMAFKAYNYTTVSERMCHVVDHILLPSCSLEHMVLSEKPCNPKTLTRNLTYTWSNQTRCKGGDPLLADIELVCSSITVESHLSIGVLSTAGVVIVFFLVLMGIVHMYRERPAIKISSYVLRN